MGAYEGWSVGAVSVKRARLLPDGSVRAEVCRHGGEPERLIDGWLGRPDPPVPDGIAVTGPLASDLFALPYVPESRCIEVALRQLRQSPDIVLSLGGETFVLYCLAGGMVRSMLSSTRCAAGSGEFLIQQFGRMKLDLAAGIEAAGGGRLVQLASRCSVHCKSDATHKLNKGECLPADIARSLIADLATKIAALTQSANWPREEVLLAGGLVANHLLVSDLRRLVPDSRIEVLPESTYLDAFGAAVAATDAGRVQVPPPGQWLRRSRTLRLARRPPLGPASARVTRMQERTFARPAPGMEVILGVDAGSTTTKAILFDLRSRRPVAGCYLRTHGNPVQATGECLAELRGQLEGTCPPDEPVRVVQAAATGSGRELVSVYLDNCLSFNEILAHSRAAREVAPAIDTLFELGGQDAKFVFLQGGIPVDYSMNDGCSAGTGSFLEEAAASDMAVPVQEVGRLALESCAPIAFGERCAAFINSDVRAALQQGAPRADVLAGLVYSIVDNYLARVVGARHIGRTVLLQGGVALNAALGPAVAASTGREVVVPPYPELMGCLGAAQMAGDLLEAGGVGRLDRGLESFATARMEQKGTFRCPTCDNGCEIRRIGVNGEVHSYGGLCAKWEVQRRPRSLRPAEGKDLVSLRSELMFGAFSPEKPRRPRGRIGLPRALSTHALYPLYAALLSELGYEVVLSRPGQGSRHTYAPTCYPGEIVHAAVDDLLGQGVDHVFLPYLREFEALPGNAHAYLCPVAQDIPGILKAAFASHSSRMLSPEIGLSGSLLRTSEQQIVELAGRLGVGEAQARQAWAVALARQREFERRYREEVRRELEQVKGPSVVLVGRPYAAFCGEVNLSVPRKIASRGFTVIPGDALPSLPARAGGNVWHFTQEALSAVGQACLHHDWYVCALSCFSCGPDAIIHHRLRHELRDRPFCFLEIDSHTAHAGIETRIGAFLDIIEERRRGGMGQEPPRHDGAPSRVSRVRGKMGIVDPSGRLTRLDDPRVLHVLLADLPPITSRMFASLYSGLGWRSVTTPATSHQTLLKARQVCSGRECLPFLAMMGKVVAHLETRPPGEITVFHLLEQEGPCQIGNWFDAFDAILSRLGRGNAVAVWPRIQNNYLGGGDRVALFLAAATLVGDLLEEARSALRCLARAPERALEALDALEDEVLRAGPRGLLAVERELRKVARHLSQVPLHHGPEGVPRVLLFGGINRIFVDKPVREFFESRGILVKTNDISEFISLVEFEPLVRSGFAHSRTRPVEHHSAWNIAADCVRGPGREAARRALRGRIHLQAIEWLERRWRRIMARSGLLFGSYVPFREVAARAHDRVSWNGWTEAPCTLGRYFSSLDAGAFEGYVNVGAFNCAPANTVTAVIGAERRRSDVPYAAIDADGTSLTQGQLRQLETVAAQMRARYPAGRPSAPTEEQISAGGQPRPRLGTAAGTPAPPAVSALPPGQPAPGREAPPQGSAAGRWPRR